ncbi:TetR/AcrR family transcriptional regulator [Brevibacterium zhoupengii]|uniref:TetR/AcrR family transcriptional regulator n=1 Tax=Brevibacterium zhoupengii TaxID=2898795 RepID=UPI001E29DC37|nr:TetR/AcrR family transcriptional regulator [Brevibacterium zhoupengii]
MTDQHEQTLRLTPAAERILTTASRLFYEFGIHAVGVDRIAEESGITKKTLYERFGSKQELVLAYLRRREEQWRRALKYQLSLVPEAGLDRILAVFDAADNWYSGRSTKGCSAVNARAEVAPNPEGLSILTEVTEQKTWMLNTFVELCKEASVSDPVRTGQQLQLLLEGALVTLGTRSFMEPVTTAREAAKALVTTG